MTPRSSFSLCALLLACTSCSTGIEPGPGPADAAAGTIADGASMLDAQTVVDAGSSDASQVIADATAASDSGADDAGSGPCMPPPPERPEDVRTPVGTFRGTPSGATRSYLGIPYALPPVGLRRFAPPQPAECRNEIFDAVSFGPKCPQLDEGQVVGAEDCLSLNVWTAPQNVAAPVLFFIHGGGNNVGSSSAVAGSRVVYDGTSLAARGNVVVTVNYRLGALGFAAHPDLDRAGPPSGNWALRDLVLALDWVQTNIHSFGGDPSRVMVFGESAGGLNTCLLYFAPPARGRFSRALIESGGCTASPRPVGVNATTRLIEASGCTGTDAITCLRSKTPAELLQALPPEVTGLTFSDFGPIVDGVVIPEPLPDLAAQGRHANVPLILGTNANETYLMLPPPAQVATAAAYEQLARAFLGSSAVPASSIDDIVALYAPTGSITPHESLVALTTDIRWTCAGRFALTQLSSHATSPRYRYFFDHALDSIRAPVLSRAGAYHGMELFYVFGSVDGAGGYRPTEADLRLSNSIQVYWSQFAATGDPNLAAEPSWPVWSPLTDAYQRLSDPISSGEGLRRERCDALEAAIRF